MYKLTRNPGFIKGVILKSISNQTPFYMTYCTNRPPQPLHPPGPDPLRVPSDPRIAQRRSLMAWIKDAEGLGEETVFSSQVELASVGKIAGAWWVWLWMSWVAPPCKKDAIVTSRIVLNFLEGGGQPKVSVGNLGVVEVLEKHFGEWRDVGTIGVFWTRFGCVV